MKTRLGYVAAFLAGAAAAVIGAAFIGGDGTSSIFGQSETLSDSAIHSAPASAANVVRDVSGSDEARPDLPFDFACRPRPGESPSEEFQRLLRELVQSPDGERRFRLGLLLARLRQGGAASVPVILDYLKTGRDLSSESISGEAALFGGGDYYRNMRTYLFLALVQIAENHPELRSQIASAALEQARDLGEALTMADAATTDPKTREQALAAITRLLTEQDAYQRFYATAGAMVKLQGAELVSTLAKIVENQPFHHYIDAYLAALWNFPDETRIAMSKRLIASEAVRQEMRHHPDSWLWLDAREPELRAAIAQDFQARVGEESRMNLLSKLAQDRQSSQSRFHGGFPIGTATPTAGSPDSKAQIQARIALLDDLAPFCNTSQLRLVREEVRAQLVALAAQP